MSVKKVARQPFVHFGTLTQIVLMRFHVAFTWLRNYYHNTVCGEVDVVPQAEGGGYGVGDPDHF